MLNFPADPFPLPQQRPRPRAGHELGLYPLRLPSAHLGQAPPRHWIINNKFKFCTVFSANT